MVLDSEGLAIAPDGTFWVSDEYGPHIIHFDKNGNTIEKINPFNTSRKIPKVLLKDAQIAVWKVCVLPRMVKHL